MKEEGGVPREAKLVKVGRKKKKAIMVTFPFNWDDVERVRSLPNAKFYREGIIKYWLASISVEAIEKLNEWEFDVDERLQGFLEDQKVDKKKLEKISIPGLDDVLYPFQKEGVAFLEQRNGKALIADEMGLGKTVQSLTWLKIHPKQRPVVIVVPASLKLNWEREVNKWLDNPNVEVLYGTVPYEIKSEIVIINYDILKDWVHDLREYSPQVLITDEAHMYKNNKAQRTKAVKMIAKRTPHVIALTGTPVVSKPIEIYNAVNIIDPTIFPDWWKYIHKYCDAHRDWYGLKYDGASNTEELHKKLTSTIMLRRKKEDVLKELPDKVKSFVPIEIDNKEEYEKAKQDFIGFILETKGKKAARRASNAETLARINTLKQVAAKGKLETASKWIRNIIDTDGKMVVFATHTATVDMMANKFKGECVIVDGRVTGDKRQKAIDAFWNDPNKKLFIGNLQAAGVGLNLQCASNVAFLELGWTPSEHDQASDRVHRIGQKDSVNVYYLIAQDTIEEDIAELIDNKRVVVDQVTDGKETEQESLLTVLINKYNDYAIY